MMIEQALKMLAACAAAFPFDNLLQSTVVNGVNFHGQEITIS